VPWTWWPHEDVGHTDEASKELLSLFPGGSPFDTTPKPSRLLERIFQIATNAGDLVLDSFAGSGTTGHAVLKLNQSAPDKELRRFILVEMEARNAREVTAERARRVAEGTPTQRRAAWRASAVASAFVSWASGCSTRTARFGKVVRFADLARHVYFTETGEPLPRERISAKSPFLAVCRGVGIYLLFNGILGDKSAQGGNVLTRATLAQLTPFDGPKVIYCAGCLLGPDRLQADGITARQTPYEIKTT
jgi:adenine-specific DNA-methyltransferase